MKRLHTILLLLVLALNAIAANFTTIPPTRVVEGEKFTVTFRLDNGEGSDLRVSQINGCTLVYGPSTSTSHSYQVVNGKAQSSSRMEYHYTYRADKAGTFTIPEASIVVDGKKLTTKPVKFTVQSRAQADRPANQRPVDIYDVDTQSSDRPVANNDVFIRIILSRTKVYEQEAIECVIKLYTKYSISQFIATKQPSFDGFLIQEVDVRPELNIQESYNGQTYGTAVLKKCIIFPQKSGKLTINSGNYDLNVVQYENISLGGVMSIQQPRERKIKVSSNSASVDVMALPEPKPAGFNGAVGRFNINSQLVGNSFRTNDPATLIYTITGQGNIKYLKEPVIDFPSEFEQYTPQANFDTSVHGQTVAGSVKIEYTFIPQAVGDFTIGSDKFVYFDPEKRDYVTLTTPSYDIKVAQGVAAAASKDQKKIEAKNTDILHIRPVTGQSFNHTLVVRSFIYWLLYILVIGVLAGVLIIYRRQIRLNADVKGRRLAKAGKVARQRLSKARKFMSENNADAFYEEILRALNGYLGDKFALGASQLSRENIAEAVARAGGDETVINALDDVLQRCEMARYTPDSSSKVSEVYGEVTNVINTLESLKPAKK